MLYDILFIDDDFDNENSNIEESNAQKLFLELVRDNLRVTYTTGELDDLKKLRSKDLSCIKYIFCDLHLLGIAEDDDLKKINSKIIRIFKNLDAYITTSMVTVYINSEFVAKNYEDAGIQDLKNKFENVLDKEYQIESVGTKNVISKEMKSALRKRNLKVHLKSLIINAAIEVERIFDDKLKTGNFADVINFNNKHRKFINDFELNSVRKQQIRLLQQIRNKLAHTDNNLGGIKDNNIRKALQKKPKNPLLKFKSFDDLTKYLEHIEQLKNDLKSAPSINK